LKASILSSLSSQIAVVDRKGRIIASNEQWRAFTAEQGAHPNCNREENDAFGSCRGCEPACQPGSGLLAGAREVWEGSRASCEMEYECLSQGGEKRWFLMTVTPLQSPEGGAVIAHHDITASKRSEQAIRDLSGKLITAQEEERSRIARELHDDINQQLALLAIDLQLLAKSVPPGAGAHTRLEQLWKKTTDISADVQALSHQLHSAKLEHLGLISALRELCQDFRTQQKVAVEFQSMEVPPTLGMEVSLTLFRIAQECLRNVGKHSYAGNVRVNLQGSSGHLVLRISDDGVGFSSGLHSARIGLGMVSMRERLRLVGGELMVRPADGGGTVVEARVPVTPREEEASPSPVSIQAGRSSVGGERGDEQSAREGSVDRINQVRSHS
ncbi:MAG: ATP-binding protein, partial [Candidatus Methylomirabilis sp.]